MIPLKAAGVCRSHTEIGSCVMPGSGLFNGPGTDQSKVVKGQVDGAKKMSLGVVGG